MKALLTQQCPGTDCGDVVSDSVTLRVSGSPRVDCNSPWADEAERRQTMKGRPGFVSRGKRFCVRD